MGKKNKDKENKGKKGKKNKGSQVERGSSTAEVTVDESPSISSIYQLVVEEPNPEEARRKREEARRQKEEEERLKAENRRMEAQKALDELGALTGMSEVKSQVEQLIKLSEISKKRQELGLKVEHQTNHMIFKGNPGTGKTTAARIIGKAYAALGMLKTNVKKEEPKRRSMRTPFGMMPMMMNSEPESNNNEMPFIEVHFTDIESKWAGEAEENIKKKFEEARGGVLFFDEAYALVGPYHHHKTMMAVMVQCIEDMRDEVLVIAAGYSLQMEEFLDFNPGLRSRFANIVEFPDYEQEALIEIARKMAKDRDYDFNSSYEVRLMKRLGEESKLRSFGNARTVRNIVEQSIRLHAVRMSDVPNPTKEALMTLTGADIDMTVRKPEEEDVGMCDECGHVHPNPTKKGKFGGVVSFGIGVSEGQMPKMPMDNFGAAEADNNG